MNLKTRKIAVLGATGSVGTQAVDVIRHFGMSLTAVSCFKDISKAENIIREFNVPLCAVTDAEAAKKLKIAVADTSCKVIGGADAAEKVAYECECDTLLNSITGIAGLLPTVAALKSGKALALANKESLVTGGNIVMALAKENNLPVLPVDSEHSAIWQALGSGKREQVKRLILTASGGPFFGYSSDMLTTVTSSDALKHPTWSMGAKITVDSATMMNKGFEIIEAAHLFDIDTDFIDVIVHRESIIHSMVEYNDNAVIAQMGAPDMKLCVQYALTAPDRLPGPAQPLDFSGLSKMTFYPYDSDVFPLLELAKRAYKSGTAACVALNGSNEVAVDLFLNGKINLPKLFLAVMRAVDVFKNHGCNSIDEIFYVDNLSRKFTNDFCKPQ